MPLRWNADHQPLVVDNNRPAVMPGESHDFTDEQIAAGLGGLWIKKNPRAGAKKALARGRKAVKETTEPAEPEKE